MDLWYQDKKIGLVLIHQNIYYIVFKLKINKHINYYLRFFYKNITFFTNEKSRTVSTIFRGYDSG